MGKIKGSKIFFLIVLLVVTGVNAFIIYNFLNPTRKVTVALLESENYSTEVKTDFNDPGYEVKVGKDVLDKKDYTVEVKGEVDTSKLGEYELTYNIKYKHKTYEVKRKVNVVDTEAPTLNVENEKIEIDYCTKKEKSELKYSVVDNYDEDLTEKVTREEIEEKIVLTVEDSSGNKTIKEVPIEYTAKPKDVLGLNGSANIYVVVGGTYEEQGVKSEDGCGNKLGEVKTEGSVDTSKVGDYVITYIVNKNGKEEKLTRTVHVVENVPIQNNEDGTGKVVYLTFDDGPGGYTQSLLDILDKYPEVKVTFFVTNQFPKYNYLIGEEARRGHTVAVHTLTHKWNIYTNVETYRDDFNKMNDIIEQQTGKRSQLFRFPGGSSNTISRNYSKGVVRAIAQAMQADGYVYFDWNVDSEDAAGAGTERAYNNVVRGISRRNSSVVLMHDIHKTSIPAAERIIQYGLEHGYTFKGLTTSSPTAHHGINN